MPVDSISPGHSDAGPLRSVYARKHPSSAPPKGFTTKTEKSNAPPESAPLVWLV